MAKRSVSLVNWLQATVVRVTYIHFAYVAVYVASIIVFDSWNLFVHTDINNRWMAATILLIVTTIIWYAARLKLSNEVVYISLILLLCVADIVFASYNTYWERGLASKAVALYIVPIITAATLRSRSSLLGVTTLCVAAYSMTVMRYYNLHYGESLRVELYGYVGFYCALFFILAGLLLVLIQPKNQA